MLHAPKDKTVLHLQIARFLRSIAQGIAVVDMTLYLKDLHWSGAAIGGVMSGASIVGAALILLVGLMSDRLGRKPFLVIYETMTAIAALLMLVSTNSILLTLVIVFTGFGRGQNGAAGPFTPAEQAWMASRVSRSNRGSVFSTNTALGFFGLTIGSLLAGTTRLWQKSLPGAAGFDPLFALMFLISISCMVVIATTPADAKPVNSIHHAQSATMSDGPEPSDSARQDTSAADRGIRRQENKNIAKLFGVNVLNGLAVGFMGPMMSYWFSERFGVSSSQIGVTLALSFVLTGISSLMTGVLARRFGVVKSVVWLRLFGSIMILFLPIAPSYWLASTIFVMRSAFTRGTQGARSALSTSLTRDNRRGFSVSMNALGARLPSSIGPTLSGALMDTGEYSIQFFVAGGLQLISALLYGRLFRSFDASSGSTKSAKEEG